MNDEPVFIRHGRSGQYMYNRRNPVGRALFILTPFVAIGVLYGYYSSVHWSEGEFREAVHKGVQDVNSKRHRTTPDSDHGHLIAEAIRESGTGPGHGVDARRDEDGYNVSTEDTETQYCVRITLTLDKQPPVLLPGAPDPPPPTPGSLAFYRATATVTDGAC
ncbi:hypothetical protein [Streptomyces vilmorinianum]|uniref:hypothetical protein n=1 Tax=Streptomyces vilmorinianum TaxID=3051092 RepID=UPI0010FB9DBA|nr:hypothetical protein [Streptomyces vilmorinianum]